MNFNSGNTAIKRNGPSFPAKFFVEKICSKISPRYNGINHPECRINTILDYGCGYGDDVKYYEQQGFTAAGYDPDPKFGHTYIPDVNCPQD